MPDQKAQTHGVTMRRIHRSLAFDSCSGTCSRRHYFQAVCACGWTDTRGRQRYVQREVDAHLAAAGGVA